MASVFISHSSRDAAAASEIDAWLKSRGFDRVFLDFDKHSGIQPGADWERTLYRQIARTQAVIILLTPNWLESKWCFAEYTQARALGKAIFPIVETPVGERLISPDIQYLDLTLDREGGLARLAKALTEIALNAQGGFEWDASRSPFPGLNAFEEEDAAIYFGRDDDIRRLIERLNARRVQGGAKVLVLYGDSGCGKSSMMRAGLLPRLKRDRRQWIVLPAFRPQVKPVLSLARAVADALGTPADRFQWYEALSAPDPAPAIRRMIDELHTEHGALEATILLPVDQGEELFGTSEAAEAETFFNLLNAAFDTQSALALVSIRADYLSLMQKPGRALDRIEEFALAPLPAGRIPQIIEGPGHVAGIAIDGELVAAAARDAGNEDALPLLAFALRELYVRLGRNRRWNLSDYSSLGDAKEGLGPLENAVRRSAQEAVDETKLSSEELLALRDAFIPNMVRLVDKGRTERDYARQPANLDGVPPLALPILDRLAAARLLVIRAPDTETSTGAESKPGSADGVHRNRVVEVAHEALFRTWPLLSGWLVQDRVFLLGKAQLKEDLAEWQKAAPSSKDAALLSGMKLTRAAEWLKTRRSQLSAGECAYIEASVAWDKARRHEEAELKRQSGRRRKLLIAASIALPVLATGLFTYFNYLKWVETRPWARLIDQETGQVYELQEKFATLGRKIREGAGVDYQVPLTPQNISRLHLTISDGGIAIDQRSLYGTTINAETLPYSYPGKLHDGDIIALAGLKAFVYRPIVWHVWNYVYAPPEKPPALAPAWGILIDGRRRTVWRLTDDEAAVVLDEGGVKPGTKDDPNAVLIVRRRPVTGFLPLSSVSAGHAQASNVPQSPRPSPDEIRLHYIDGASDRGCQHSSGKALMSVQLPEHGNRPVTATFKESDYDYENVFLTGELSRKQIAEVLSVTRAVENGQVKPEYKGHNIGEFAYASGDARFQVVANSNAVALYNEICD